MHAALHISDSLPVNHAHLADAARLALCEVRGDEVPQFLGTKRVQVQHTVDRQLERLIIRIMFVHASLWKFFARRRTLPP